MKLFVLSALIVNRNVSPAVVSSYGGWRFAETENEAKGAFVAAIFRDKPNHAIEDMGCSEVPMEDLAALDAIMDAASEAANRFAGEYNGISVEVVEHPYPNDLEKMVRVRYGVSSGDPGDMVEMARTADELDGAINRAITGAIGNADWEERE